MNQLNSLHQKFDKLFGESHKKASVFFAPGRVNLIGEHTDYNGGYVFPCALNLGTYLLARENEEKCIRFASTNLEYKAEIPLDEMSDKKDDKWVNYPLGVIQQLKKRGLLPKGLDMLYSGDIPNGAGLSSSASIELVTAFALNRIWSGSVPILEMVKLSQRAENEFVGMNCGIMDQFAVGMGRERSALFLNCDTLDYELVPLNLRHYKMVIANTNKRRGLTDSKYNERRSECEIAVEYLKEGKNIRNLSELSLEEFDRFSSLIPEKIIRNRAKHVISENDRVLRAVAALKKGDLNTFGKLMNASHDSLREDYEVTGMELDTLVEEARKISGVIGSRMTGAGFGGCTVSLVEEDQVSRFLRNVGENYEKRTHLKADFYLPEVGSGPKELSEGSE